MSTAVTIEMIIQCKMTYHIATEKDFAVHDTRQAVDPGPQCLSLVIECLEI
jgi:hypothetical protein